jgi:hypothetical protein
VASSEKKLANFKGSRFRSIANGTNTCSMRSRYRKKDHRKEK